ncbi:ankyrin repeat and LEM domain-containing protein 2 isoform X2 [Photinus pyralis]|uniref:ANKLE2 third alpha/beta domain-containing protein n=1 Tax=Photinus pyralis TaxID=7054 RepID=A0A1Y1N2R8_PHOPY|nr:ankyrin repeat and LEM domain-containing protein 2 isoform X2 [Photinus pyralis]
MGSQNNIPNGQEISSDTVYYGVHIPYDVQVEHNDESTVFQDKMEAFKLIKKYKQARFKAFHFYHEAVEFAVNGSENHNKLIVYEIQSTKDPPIIGEKPPAFRGPKSQDLVKLRKNIEAGLLDVVSSCIWENPRYLISSGDTPSILQEGSRYNALHVAAKSRNRDMCELILNTVSNTNFIKLLYGDDSHQDANERAVMLLDLYLNTPDKGLNETPLHFAAKFGAVEVVELLVSYSQCDKALLNKYGKTASMIICDRCDSSLVHLKNKIALLLDENFYVPVLRSEDNCIPPVIGEPFSPSSPPNLAKDIFSPRVEIRAYAGPMDRESAARFRRAWKTPPRSLKAANVALNLKFDDLEKGVERLGKNLSMQFDVSWKEYWAFLDEFVDLSTSEGLQIFENYLSERYKAEMVGNDTDSERSTKEIDHDNTTSPMSELSVEDFMELDDEENEIYHTPPSSPEITNLSDDDTFEDCPLPDHDIFIEGNVPTKTDHVAYNAVKFAVAILNPQDYPFVYKWFHTVGFCSSYDRKNWPSPKVGKYTVETPGRAPPAQTSTPISKSWMRVTGTNSPRSTLKRYSRGSLSFN